MRGMLSRDAIKTCDESLRYSGYSDSEYSAVYIFGYPCVYLDLLLWSKCTDAYLSFFVSCIQHHKKRETKKALFRQKKLFLSFSAREKRETHRETRHQSHTRKKTL